MSRAFEPLGLDHVVLRVRDQAASQRFYIEVLGCTLDHVNERDLAGAAPLRRAAHRPAARRARARAAASTTSACRSAAATSGALRDELRARGVTVDGDVVERRGAFGTGPSLYMQDPDGYRIELKPR